MGLLDDAIREHLDLKRQHGADPEEVDRAEREALGPVRRGPEDVAVEEPEHGYEDDQGLGHEEFDAEEFTAEGDDRDWGELDEREPPPVPGADAQREPEPPLAEHHGAEPQDEAVPEDETELFDHGDETAEYDVEGELRRESQQDGEDVLEETPEFLQDTPEHDRLWFEQRPPRDFDFDG